MTHKHFQLIADVLRNSNAPERTIAEMASALATTNPRFNRHRFMVAAGYSV